jgi:hypothetical protein
MTKDEALKALYETMKQYADFGASDSEGYQAVDRVDEAIEDGRRFPLRTRNPFQLYESRPGWDVASGNLINAALLYWQAGISERLEVSINVDAMYRSQF